MVSDVKFITYVTPAESQLLVDEIPVEDSEIEKETIIKREMFKEDLPETVKDKELGEDAEEEE